jgi:hypothetical protein
MSEEENQIPLEAFQDKVLEEIRMLQSMVEINAGFRRTFFNRAAGHEQSRKKGDDSLQFKLSMRLAQYTLKNLKELKKIDENTTKARAFLKEAETRLLLCERLKAVEDNLSRLEIRDTEHDAAEIATAITPMLLPSARARSISLADDPVAFALCAWILARTSIKTYCAGMSETEPLSL